MARQLRFDWPERVSLGREDYFVSIANAHAFAMVSAPQSWPDGKLALIGPKRSGKTHLARLFAQSHEALVLRAGDFRPDMGLPDARFVVVENVETLPQAGEEILFHLHNALRGAGRLLLTSDRAPSRWQIALPDLASRMQACALAQVDDPDDRLLMAVIMKQFQDRQIAPSPGLPAYLVARIDRSFAAAADIVARLDAMSLAQGREVNERLAREALEKIDDNNH